MKKLLELMGGAALALIALVLFALLTLATSANAQHYNATDGYVTAVATTNTTLSEVVFAGAPTKTIRLLSALVQSESTTGHFYIYGGTAPYPVTGVLNGTNLIVSSTAGLVTNRLVILQYGGTNWTATLLYTNQGTNAVLGGGSGLGFTPLTNSVLWHCRNLYLDGIGQGKRQTAGEAIFAGVVRGPLAVRVDPAIAASNRLAVTVKYEISP